jgi:hypothetical protein
MSKHLTPLARFLLIIPFVVALDAINLAAVSARWVADKLGCDSFLLPQIWRALQDPNLDE